MGNSRASHVTTNPADISHNNICFCDVSVLAPEARVLLIFAARHIRGPRWLQTQQLAHFVRMTGLLHNTLPQKAKATTCRMQAILLHLPPYCHRVAKYVGSFWTSRTDKSDLFYQLWGNMFTQAKWAAYISSISSNFHFFHQEYVAFITLKLKN